MQRLFSVDNSIADYNAYAFSLLKASLFIQHMVKVVCKHFELSQSIPLCICFKCGV